MLAASSLVAPFSVTRAGPFEDGQAANKKDDYATAFQIFRPLADQGDAHAQFNLGVMYDRGQGVPQDYAQALVWLLKAADQGIAQAQANLGWMYANGRGVRQDFAQAVIWLRKAADQGTPTRRTPWAGCTKRPKA